MAKRKRSLTPSDTESSGREMSTSTQDSPSPEPPPAAFVVTKAFCSFCGDHMGGQVTQCADCAGFMCEQTEPNGPGCILAGTLDRNVPFRCVVCEPRHWRKTVGQTEGKNGNFPYGFSGYGGRKRSKLSWPMVLGIFTLATLQDRYIDASLGLDFKMHYTAFPDNLRLVKVRLKAKGDKKASAEIAQGVDFIERSIQSRFPANTFIVIDTHSQVNGGRLQWASGAGGSKHSVTSEVVQKFVGPQLLAKMKRAAEEARMGQRPADEKVWYDDSAFSRGGWRGLLLSTCAPVMRVEESFKDLKSLVEGDTFDFVMGFAGSSTLPSQVKGVLSGVIERLGVDKTAGIWETVMSVVGHDLHLLEVNTVVVIYRERGSAEVFARKIGRHAPPMRPWGVDFRACATAGCDRTALDFFVKNDDYDVRMECRVCRWKSAWVKECHWKEHVFRLDSTLPKIFWHSYPPSQGLQNIFVGTTREKENEGSRVVGKGKKAR